MISELEQKLNDTKIAITTKILYYPCEKGRDRVEYLNSMMVTDDVLMVSVTDKSYINIVKNVYEGLLNKKLDNIWELNNKERKLMYDTISSNPLYQYIKKM